MADHREAPFVFWSVIPPGADREVLTELELPVAPFEGLSLAADTANETAGGGFNCWIAILVEDDQFLF